MLGHQGGDFVIDVTTSVLVFEVLCVVFTEFLPSLSIALGVTGSVFRLTETSKRTTIQTLTIHVIVELIIV
jgi:ABC-type transport system involved in cytochrome bd biosynthesis fused ATPase/permease subunit